MNLSSKPIDNKDKTPLALDEIVRWRETKVKGKIVLHFDGSGRIALIEETVSK